MGNTWKLTAGTRVAILRPDRTIGGYGTVVDGTASTALCVLVIVDNSNGGAYSIDRANLQVIEPDHG